MGDIYGGQTAGVSWKNHRTHVLVVKGGFIECKNMESMHFHPARGIKMAIHVDGPLVSSPNMVQTTWVHDFMDLEFDTNGRNILTVGKQIDYLSMKIPLPVTASSPTLPRSTSSWKRRVNQMSGPLLCHQ